MPCRRCLIYTLFGQSPDDYDLYHKSLYTIKGTDKSTMSSRSPRELLAMQATCLFVEDLFAQAFNSWMSAPVTNFLWQKAP